MKDYIPKLSPGCRLKDDVLLIPEGMMKLKGAGAEILVCCDGNHTIEQIVSILCLKRPTEDRSRIENETVAFFKRLSDLCVLRLSV